MADLFDPPYAPTVGSRVETAHRVLKATFGDGYSQRMPEGVQAADDTVVLNWEGATAAEAATLKAFLDSQGGYKRFRYTLPDEAVERYWTCETHGRVYSGRIVRAYSATFEEALDV